MIGGDGWGFLVICECGVLFPFVRRNYGSVMVSGFVFSRGKRTTA